MKLPIILGAAALLATASPLAAMAQTTYGPGYQGSYSQGSYDQDYSQPGDAQDSDGDYDQDSSAPPYNDGGYAQSQQQYQEQQQQYRDAYSHYQDQRGQYEVQRHAYHRNREAYERARAQYDAEYGSGAFDAYWRDHPRDYDDRYGPGAFARDYGEDRYDDN